MAKFMKPVAGDKERFGRILLEIQQSYNWDLKEFEENTSIASLRLHKFIYAEVNECPTSQELEKLKPFARAINITFDTLLEVAGHKFSTENSEQNNSEYTSLFHVNNKNTSTNTHKIFACYKLSKSINSNSINSGIYELSKPIESTKDLRDLEVVISNEHGVDPSVTILYWKKLS